MNVSPYTVLDIPSTMGPMTFLVTGTATALLPVLFFGEIFRQKINAIMGEKTEYVKTFALTLFVMLCFGGLHRIIFMKIVALCDLIGMMSYAGADWGKFIKGLRADADVGIMKIGTTAVITVIFSFILDVIDDVFTYVRYTLLSILYVVGPLAWASLVSGKSRAFFRGWFRAVWEVSFWVVLFNIMHGALLALNNSAASFGLTTATTTQTVNGISIILMTIAVPMLTRAFFSDGNMGAVGSGMVAFGTGLMTLKRMTQYGTAIRAGIGLYKKWETSLAEKAGGAGKKQKDAAAGGLVEKAIGQNITEPEKTR